MSRAKVNYKNPDFADDVDDFADIVDDYIKQRKQLKKNLKEQRAETIISERVGERPLTKEEKKQKPTIEAIERLGKEIKRGRNVYLTMYQNSIGLNKTQGEVKATGKEGIGKLGLNGEVNLSDLDQNIFTVRNTRTGETFTHKLTDDLATLLFQPSRLIKDFNDIDNASLQLYYQAMKTSGISGRANNNKKLKISKQVYDRNNRIQQQANRPPSDADEEKEGDEVYMPEERAPRRRKTGKERAKWDDERAQRSREKGRQERQFRNQQIRQSRRRAALYDRRARRYNTDQFMNAYNQRMNIDEDIAELARGGLAPGGFFDTENPEDQQGRGLNLATPDEMVNRLSLLFSSQSAGNISDELYNEASDIISKLKKMGILSAKEVKKLYKTYLD